MGNKYLSYDCYKYVDFELLRFFFVCFVSWHGLTMYPMPDLELELILLPHLEKDDNIACNPTCNSHPIFILTLYLFKMKQSYKILSGRQQDNKLESRTMLVFLQRPMC